VERILLLCRIIYAKFRQNGKQPNMSPNPLGQQSRIFGSVAHGPHWFSIHRRYNDSIERRRMDTSFSSSCRRLLSHTWRFVSKLDKRTRCMHFYFPKTFRSVVLIYFDDAFKVFEEWLLDADWSLNAANWQWLSASAFFHQYFR